MVRTISDVTLFEDGVASREKIIASVAEFTGWTLNKKSEIHIAKLD